MNCKEAHQQIHLFTELTSADRDQVLNHINECKECMELAESMKFMTSIVNRTTRVNIEPFSSTHLTNKIMSEISKPQLRPISLFELILSYIELKQVRLTMATVSALLIILLVAEQTSIVQTKRYYTSEIIPTSNNATILNAKSFRDRLQKYKATEKFMLSSNCKNPFNAAHYNAECLREKTTHFKTL